MELTHTEHCQEILAAPTLEALAEHVRARIDNFEAGGWTVHTADRFNAILLTEHNIDGWRHLSVRGDLAPGSYVTTVDAHRTTTVTISAKVS